MVVVVEVEVVEALEEEVVVTEAVTQEDKLNLSLASPCEVYECTRVYKKMTTYKLLSHL